MTLKKHIKINIEQQKLTLLTQDTVIQEYGVSTAKNGVSSLQHSECTPLGMHIINEKIGDGCAPNTVFVGRVATGELYHNILRKKFPERDWILTRILRLNGCELGFNKGGIVDSYARYIYIHGCPDDIVMGVLGSKGCIRMRNQDIIALFDLVQTNTQVNIIR